jgi:transcriptional regulator of arginine metabolism
MNIHSPAAVLRRREEILRIVDQEAIHSQEALAERLSARGWKVAQPTLSRDLRELGLAKSPRGYARPGAAPPDALRAQRESNLANLDRTVREFVLSVTPAGTLVVLRTPPAGAHPVARALDEAALPEVIGTIAGDDTIFLAAASPPKAQRLARRLAEGKRAAR